MADQRLSAIYIMCPASLATGGPELLHQLAFELKKQGRQVRMCYVGSRLDDPVHANYKEYGIDWVTQADDSDGSTIVFPEVYTDKLQSFKRARKVIWWLSVDNHFRSRTGILGRIHRSMFRRYDISIRWPLSRSVFGADLHLAQSFYALDVLRRHRIRNAEMLSDYLHPLFLEERPPIRKEDLVAYNPWKGSKHTRRLMALSPGIDFVPIKGMTREQVVNLLERAKVYIDLGHHPGRDRIPREAACLGCCVMTGRRGSAGYREDVPIPDRYKFSSSTRGLRRMRETIIDCFDHYDERQRDFDAYRQVIRGQRMEFEQAVMRWFP